MQAAAASNRDINNVAAKRGCAKLFPPFSCNALTPPSWSVTRRRPFHNHNRSGVTACRRATLVTRTTALARRSASAWRRSPSAAGCAACQSRRPTPRGIRTRSSLTRSRPSRRAAAPSTRPTSAPPTAAATNGVGTSRCAACSPSRPPPDPRSGRGGRQPSSCCSRARRRRGRSNRRLGGSS